MLDGSRIFKEFSRSYVTKLEFVNASQLVKISKIIVLQCSVGKKIFKCFSGFRAGRSLFTLPPILGDIHETDLLIESSHI